MKQLFFILVILTLFSCSNDDEQERLMYDITYSVTALNGATINKIEYLDSQGDLIELTNVTSPWSHNSNLKA